MRPHPWWWVEEMTFPPIETKLWLPDLCDVCFPRKTRKKKSKKKKKEKQIVYDDCLHALILFSSIWFILYLGNHFKHKKRVLD